MGVVIRVGYDAWRGSNSSAKFLGAGVLLRSGTCSDTKMARCGALEPDSGMLGRGAGGNGAERSAYVNACCKSSAFT